MGVELRLVVVIEKPPAGVDFALQEGKGREYKTVQKQRSRGKELTFRCIVKLQNTRDDGLPNLLGPMTQGPPADRFLYIDIGRLAGQNDCRWGRRMKVPLAGITWELIEQSAADLLSVFEARVPGTGKDGGPSCATVEPPDGWKLVPKRRG
jgi:hypothetical protein